MTIQLLFERHLTFRALTGPELISDDYGWPRIIPAFLRSSVSAGYRSRDLLSARSEVSVICFLFLLILCRPDGHLRVTIGSVRRLRIRRPYDIGDDAPKRARLYFYFCFKHTIWQFRLFLFFWAATRPSRIRT